MDSKHRIINRIWYFGKITIIVVTDFEFKFSQSLL